MNKPPFDPPQIPIVSPEYALSAVADCAAAVWHVYYWRALLWESALRESKAALYADAYADPFLRHIVDAGLELYPGAPGIHYTGRRYDSATSMSKYFRPSHSPYHRPKAYHAALLAAITTAGRDLKETTRTEGGLYYAIAPLLSAGHPHLGVLADISAIMREAHTTLYWREVMFREARRRMARARVPYEEHAYGGRGGDKVQQADLIRLAETLAAVVPDEAVPRTPPMMHPSQRQYAAPVPVLTPESFTEWFLSNPNTPTEG